MELATLLGAFVGELELFVTLSCGVMDEMKLCTRLIRVRGGWKLAKKPMQSESGCIGDQKLTKQLELSEPSCEGLSPESVLEEVAQQCHKCWSEPVVET